MRLNPWTPRRGSEHVIICMSRQWKSVISTHVLLWEESCCLAQVMLSVVLWKMCCLLQSAQCWPVHCWPVHCWPVHCWPLLCWPVLWWAAGRTGRAWGRGCSPAGGSAAPCRSPGTSSPIWKYRSCFSTCNMDNYVSSRKCTWTLELTDKP